MKTTRELFIERLAGIGIKLINTSPDDMGDPMEILTDEQTAELEAAINDIETFARSFGEQSVRDSFAEVASGADLSDVINAMKSGHPIRISAEAVDELVENAKAEQRRAGLNDTGEVPVIDLAEANAVEFVVADNKIWLNVDGRCRARVGKASIIIAEANGNRAVIFDDRVAAVPSVIDETDETLVDYGRGPVD